MGAAIGLRRDRSLQATGRIGARMASVASVWWMHHGVHEAMSGVLRVSAEELRVVADQLDMYAADLSHDHAIAHTNMASAIPGFGAALSAAALNERISQWEHETAQHRAELERHGNGHRLASGGYAASDSDGSAQITTAGGSVDEAASGVDL